jgi:hypothetical protein
LKAKLLAVPCLAVPCGALLVLVQGMSILAEKLLVGAARLASWAPNMDVIAMVSAEGCAISAGDGRRCACAHFDPHVFVLRPAGCRQLCVYRLNWQRLWVQTCDEDVRLELLACPFVASF